MNDEAHQRQGLGQSEAERLGGDPHKEWKERAFRLTVARLWAYEGLDTKEIAERIGCEESAVYNVLQQARGMIR